ncbi:hypothetical protein F5Y09DRAFT_133444 [Xylaria sp. FL1042]|nr:hypothetical protein F5Y09DRAFT_133444 [Xylaria sp. FL1042]
MASVEYKTRKWLTCDPAALSDLELDEYLGAQRSQSSITLVKVEDPQNLPESFIQRLRDRANCSPTDAIQSRAVDLEGVNARLLEISARFNPLPFRFSSPSRQPLVSPPIGDSSTKSPDPPEVAAATYYNKRVDLGGRPAFPLHLVNEVVKNPQAYRDQLLQWQNFSNVKVPTWNIF